MLKFPATLNCRYYKIHITANQTAGNQVSNLAETGSIIKLIGDLNAYNRASWTITVNNAVNANDVVTNMIDQNTGTYWQSKFTVPILGYPHIIIIFDMKQAEPLINLSPFIILIKRRLRRRFQAPARASGFELRKAFQAAQNTTCWFPAKPFLEIDIA